MKYVMFRVQKPVVYYFPIIFPEILTHLGIAEAMKGVQFGVEKLEPVSAGFIDLMTGQCYGESESLGMGVHPDDTSITVTHPSLGGIGWADREPPKAT